jgi:hypothetical protein
MSEEPDERLIQLRDQYEAGEGQYEAGEGQYDDPEWHERLKALKAGVEAGYYSEGEDTGPLEPFTPPPVRPTHSSPPSGLMTRWWELHRGR